MLKWFLQDLGTLASLALLGSMIFVWAVILGGPGLPN